MWRFEAERINKCELDSNKFKHPIPIMWIRPKNESNNSCVIIYNSGIGSTNDSVTFMNHRFYDNHFVLSYEKMKHGNNKNKPSQFKKPYLIELDEVINWAKGKFPNKKIYLIGESWGSAINFIYYKKNPKKISGVVSWNMPTKPVDPDKRSFKQLFAFAWRYIVTLLFNVELKLPQVQSSQDKFCQNRIFARAMCIIPPSKTSSRITLAVWKYMGPSKRFLYKNSKNSTLNFLYIQSKQDVLAYWKHIDKIKNKADTQHYLELPTGYHVLSMEPKEREDLYNAIEKFINKN